MHDRVEIAFAQRRPILAEAPTICADPVSISVHQPAGRFSLRLRVSGAIAAGLALPGSLLLPMSLNTCVVAGARTIARLGPDEWLVLCPEEDSEQTAAEFSAALRPGTFSLTDISHRNAGIAVAGARSREVLNGGCPLDLSDARFAPGSATRTVFGKAEIVLLRPGSEASYRVECWRSFAPYVHGLLRHGAREFGAA